MAMAIVLDQVVAARVQTRTPIRLEALPEEEELESTKNAAAGLSTQPLTSLLHKQMQKTKLCHFFLNGTCKYGSKCAFAHKTHELKSAPDLRQTRICKAFLNGGCNNQSCNFAHGQQELRATGLCFKTTLCVWSAKGKCQNGSRCRFAHGCQELRCAEADVSASTVPWVYSEESIDVPHVPLPFQAWVEPPVPSRLFMGKAAEATRTDPMKVLPAGLSSPFPLSGIAGGFVQQNDANSSFLQGTVYNAALSALASQVQQRSQSQLMPLDSADLQLQYMHMQMKGQVTILEAASVGPGGLGGFGGLTGTADARVKEDYLRLVQTLSTLSNRLHSMESRICTGSLRPQAEGPHRRG